MTPNDYQAAFTGSSIALNPQVSGIRRSDELGDFYRANYLPNNGNRYPYLNRLQNYNFNYNYEVFDYNSNGSVSLKLMAGNATPIPSYIQAIYDDYRLIWNPRSIVNTRSIAPPLQV